MKIIFQKGNLENLTEFQCDLVDKTIERGPCHERERGRGVEEPLKLEELPEREIKLTNEGAAVSGVGQWRQRLGGRWCASGWFFFFFSQTEKVKKGIR